MRYLRGDVMVERFGYLLLRFAFEIVLFYELLGESLLRGWWGFGLQIEVAGW